MRWNKAWRLALVCGLWCAACTDDDKDTDHDHDSAAGSSATKENSAKAAGSGGSSGAAGKKADAPAGKADIAAFEATGLNKYVGKAKPKNTEMDGDEEHFFFDAEDGPVCLRGGQYSMGVRDKGSEDLVIYLQGGGSCTTALCRATETASPKIPGYGILSASDSDNPFKDWNVVYAPYCDGSLHFGDTDIPDQNRLHHGLRNASAVFDVAKSKFAKPKRILLSGSSAGGYGTIWLTALARVIYPDAKLFVFNDAGIGISKPDSPDGFRAVLEEWGAKQFIPESCEECKTSPHLTPWMSWNLQHDPGLTLAMFSAYEDSVISGTFLMLDSQVFKTALLEQTKDVVDSAPARAKRFLVDGTQHTVGDIHKTAVGDLSVADWLKQMIDSDPAWDNVLQ
jgi:hypothetical protein